MTGQWQRPRRRQSFVLKRRIKIFGGLSFGCSRPRAGGRWQEARVTGPNNNLAIYLFVCFICHVYAMEIMATDFCNPKHNFNRHCEWHLVAGRWGQGAVATEYHSKEIRNFKNCQINWTKKLLNLSIDQLKLYLKRFLLTLSIIFWIDSCINK